MPMTPLEELFPAPADLLGVRHPGARFWFTLPRA